MMFSLVPRNRAVTRTLLCALALTLASLSAAAPAHAASGACTPEPGSPSCHFWTGKVVFVADADTVDVDIDGDGTSRPRRVRLTGINAMELTRYSSYPSRRRGACHARAATSRLEGLLRQARWQVRLAAQDPRTMAGERLRRQVSARLGGSWVDVGRILAAEGHVLWLPHGVEYAWNDSYRRLTLQAAHALRNLWNPTSCGSGPAPGHAVSLNVRWDADGNDGANINGEWLELRNNTGQRVSLGGWWVRDAALRRFTFPSGTALAPHARIRVHIGRGHATSTSYYWGLLAPAFENATRDRRAMGDGGYLFDRDGDLRAWDIYPR